MLPPFLLGFGLFATSRISAITVKMSDFSLSLEDIGLLINGKIPLIIYIETRPSHAAYQVLYNFILAIYRGNPKQTPYSQVTISRSCTITFWRSTGAIHRGDPKQTPCSPVTFSRRFTLFAFQRIKKNLAFLEV